jgi:hypothetical protein
MREMIDHNRTKKIQFDLFIKILQATENEFIKKKNRNLTSTLDANVFGHQIKTMTLRNTMQINVYISYSLFSLLGLSQNFHLY